MIGIDDVKGAVLKFYENLDRGFYRLRYDRCTPKEKMFIFEMCIRDSYYEDYMAGKEE